MSLLLKEQELYISDIVVLPAYQGKGIGRQLMQFAKAKEWNCSKLSLKIVHDNIPLRNWYQKAGFQVVELEKSEKKNYTIGKMEFLL